MTDIAVIAGVMFRAESPEVHVCCLCGARLAHRDVVEHAAAHVRERRETEAA